MSTKPENPADDPMAVIGVRIGSEQLELRPSMIGVAAASALRTQSHGAWRVPTLFAAVLDGVGIEELAGLVFLARRQAAQPVTYDKVADEIDAAAAAGATVVVVYDRAAAAAQAADIASAEIVVDFTWQPEESPEA